MKKRKYLGIFLLSLSVFILGGCADEMKQETIVELEESSLNAPQKTEVFRGDIRVTMTCDAQIGPRVEQLTFEEAGDFGEFYVQLGDIVEEGDLLAAPILEGVETSIEDMEEHIDNLTRTYNYRKKTMENDLLVVNKELEKTRKTIAGSSYDEQRKRLELELKHLTETYELELPYYEQQLKELRQKGEGNMIRAPFDGTVIGLEQVEYGTPLDRSKFYVAVADTSFIYARCLNVSSTVLNQLKGVEFWKDGKTYEAVSIPMDYDYYMITKNNEEDAYLEFEIVNPNGELEHGDYGKLILIFEKKENVLLVPDTTLQLSDGSYYIYKDVEGKKEKVAVKIGAKDGINVEILEGLEEGDVIYVQE